MTQQNTDYDSIQALVTERDALKAKLGSLSAEAAPGCVYVSTTRWDEFIAENKQLKHDNERLRAQLSASHELIRVYGEETELRDKDLTELREALTKIDAEYRKQPEWNTPANGRCPECGYNTELLEALLAKLPPSAAPATTLRDELSKLTAEWRRKAEQLRNYDAGMHEVVNCANELDALLVRTT